MPIRVLRDGASGLAGLQLQAPRITHHLEIPAADALSLRAGQLAQALPVHRAGAGAAVELLVVEQGLDGEAADRCVAPFVVEPGLAANVERSSIERQVA